LRYIDGITNTGAAVGVVSVGDNNEYSAAGRSSQLLIAELPDRIKERGLVSCRFHLRHCAIQKIELISKILTQVYLVVKSGKENLVLSLANYRLNKIQRRLLFKLDFARGGGGSVHQDCDIYRPGLAEVIGERLNLLWDAILENDEIVLRKSRNKLAFLVKNRNRKQHAPDKDCF
jgi:hypothetical protein